MHLPSSSIYYILNAYDARNLIFTFMDGDVEVLCLGEENLVVRVLPRSEVGEVLQGAGS